MACVTGAVWIGYSGESERTDGFWLGQREKVRGGGMKKVTRVGCSAVALEVRAAFISKGSLPKKS